MNTKTLTIKCFGEACWIHLLASDEVFLKKYDEIARKLKLPLQEAILDFGFYSQMHTTIQSIEDLILDSFGGLTLKQPNTIEIWLNRKKIAKFSYQELIQPTTLFPLYKVQNLQLIQQDIEKGMYLKETVKGCIGVYKLKIPSFDITQLTFKTLATTFCKTPILIGFKYQQFLLKKSKEDCLTIAKEILFI